MYWKGSPLDKGLKTVLEENYIIFFLLLCNKYTTFLGDLFSIMVCTIKVQSGCKTHSTTSFLSSYIYTTWPLLFFFSTCTYRVGQKNSLDTTWYRLHKVLEVCLDASLWNPIVCYALYYWCWGKDISGSFLPSPSVVLYSVYPGCRPACSAFLFWMYEKPQDYCKSGLVNSIYIPYNKLFSRKCFQLRQAVLCFC